MDGYSRRETCGICRKGTYSRANSKCRVHSDVRAFKQETFELWKCPTCQSIISLNEVELDRYYKGYPIHKQTLDLWTRVAFRNLYLFLENIGLTDRSTFLDYGCGQGTFISYLRKKGFNNAWGYDKYSDGHRNPAVLDRKYEFILANDVLEHVLDPKALIQELSSLMAENGILVVCTPESSRINLERPSSDFRHVVHQPYHVYILSMDAFTALAAECNLEVIRSVRRFYLDSWFPSVNWKFLCEYWKSGDDTLDVGFEPPKLSRLVFNPKILFFALFGRLFPNKSEIIYVLKRRANMSVRKMGEGVPLSPVL